MIRTLLLCFTAILLESAVSCAQDRPAPAKGITTGGRPATAPAAETAPQKQERPEAPQLRVVPLDPALRKVLEEWETRSAKIHSLSGEHYRYVYNKIFENESRAKGKFYYEAPDKGRIDIVGIAPKPGEESQRKNPQGVPYQLKADGEEKWICDGKQIITITLADKSYDMIDLPPQLQGQNIIHGPLPFLFGMPVAEFQRRFKMDLLADSKDQAKISAIPLLQSDSCNYQRATIILDKSRYLPSAVQLIDPAGTQETTYVFGDLKVKLVGATGPNTWLGNIFPGANPFQPDLKGYQRVIQPSRQAAGEPGAGPTSGIRQTNGSIESPVSQKTVTNPIPRSNGPGTGPTPGTASQAAPGAPGKTTLNNNPANPPVRR